MLYVTVMLCAVRGGRGSVGAILSRGAEPNHVWLLRLQRRTFLAHFGLCLSRVVLLVVKLLAYIG